MNRTKQKDYSLINYRSSIPVILEYQLVSKAIFTFVMILFKQVASLLFHNLGRPAFTSGDIPFLMRSWQGWVLILLGFLVLVVYTIFDINAVILISYKIIHNEKIKFIEIIKVSFHKASCYKSFYGVIIVLYVSLIAPLTGAAIGISLTNNLAIPDFIMSFINDRFILNLLYHILLLALAILGFMHVFTFHFILLNNMSVTDALRSSRQIMKKNWKNFIKTYIVFSLKTILFLLLTLMITYIIPTCIVYVLHLSIDLYHIAIVFITFVAYFSCIIFALLSMYFLMMKLTLVFERYTGFDASQYRASERNSYRRIFLIALPVIIFFLLVSIVAGLYFDDIFPKTSSVKIVAHRAGGDLAHENTILGLEAAISYKADCSEIDVQRTKDNHYIINHDDTFERCCDDPHASYELNLAEVKKLKVKYNLNPMEEPTEVATIEEFLDTAKDKIKLFIELKGVTANPQMADDLYKMVKERDMIDQVMFIGLNYDLLEYVESKYPEITTGYLCFFGFGDIQNMNVDVLLLEAETATDHNIDKIHEAKKEVGIWTVDNVSSMSIYMASTADYIITDKVEESLNIRKSFAFSPDTVRVIEAILPK